MHDSVINTTIRECKSHRTVMEFKMIKLVVRVTNTFYLQTKLKL